MLHFAAIVLSAAKKKEYEAFSLFRQPSFPYFFNLRFTLHLHALFCEGANYSQARRGLASIFLATSDKIIMASAAAPTPINIRWSPPLCANKYE